MQTPNKGSKYFDDPSLDCVIVTSDEPWTDVWMPQLHYAYQLSKRCNVIFLGPPEKWSAASMFRFGYRPEKYNERLVKVRYLNVLPLAFGIISVYINDLINELALGRSIRKNGILPNMVMWRFDPFRSMFIFGSKRRARQIFHVIDPIAGCDLDVPLSKRAELVIITSPKFIDHYRALNANVVQLSQGVDLDFYRSPANRIAEHTGVSTNSVLLLGSFTDDIDYIFLKKLAAYIPANLVLIGPKRFSSQQKEAQFMELASTEKVHWLGPMEPARFRPHLEVCRAGIICYDNDINVKNKLRSPLKAIGYLAAGKCIISNIDCEIPSLLNKAIYMVQDENGYFSMIDRCYAGRLTFDTHAVTGYLESIDYNNLLSVVFDRLGKKLPPKV